MENTDKRNATQRIEDLERVVTQLYQAATQLQQVTKASLDTQQAQSQDLVLVKEALKLIDRKTKAIIQTASATSGITEDAVRDLVLAMNVEEMAEQVKTYLANDNITPSETVTANSFCVCEEYENDKLANPRIQFRLDSQGKETTEALLGKKAGDRVDFGADKFGVKILEVYELVAPKAETPVETAPPVEAPAPAAPANEVPAENPIEFGLQIHGQPDPSPSVVTA